MGRRRNLRFKRSTKRKVRSEKKGSDESDKDYKVGRDEELEESDDYYSLDGYESEDSLGEFEEVDEMKVKKVSRSKAKRSVGSRKGNGIKNPRKKNRITYKQEDDYNYNGDDDDGEEELMPNEMEETKKNKKVLKSVREGFKGKKKVKRKTKLLKMPVKKKTRRKKRTVRKTRVTAEEKSKKKPCKRRRTIMADSDSDSASSGSCNYKFTISEEEREQVREASKICTSFAVSLRRSSPSNRLSKRLKEEVSSNKRVNQERKGKEKVVEDLKNQVCGICLSEEQKRMERGTLNCCCHYFCFPCIMEWSKVESRCPLCKQRFTTISKPARSNKGFNLRTVSVQVPKRNQVYQPSEEELSGYIDPYESVICNECQQGGDDALMLLCDLCDSPAHTYCVGLGREVPEGNWYCEACQPADLNSQSPNSTPTQNSSNSLYVERIDLNSMNVPNTTLSLETGSGSCLRDFRPASPTSPAFTLLDRRRIHSQIRIIIDNRTSDLRGRSNVTSASTNSRIGLLSSQLDQTSRTADFSGRMEIPSSINGGVLQARKEVVNVGSGPSFFPFNPCGGRLNVEKEQVQQMVRKHLKGLSSGNKLGYQTFKDVARSSTHTILAACGLEHRANVVYPVQSPPLLCTHEEPSSSRLSFTKDFCSDCFDSFVGYVVKMIASSRTSDTIRV